MPKTDLVTAKSVSYLENSLIANESKVFYVLSDLGTRRIPRN